MRVREPQNPQEFYPKAKRYLELWHIVATQSRQVLTNEENAEYNELKRQMALLNWTTGTAENWVRDYEHREVEYGTLEVKHSAEPLDADVSIKTESGYANLWFTPYEETYANLWFTPYEETSDEE